MKARRDAPPGYFAWEAAGLRWLAAAPGGAAVVEVRDVGEGHLALGRVASAGATAAAARDFGAGLGRTHAAGAPAFGAPPEGWRGDGYLGPLSEPLPLALGAAPTWGRMWAHMRLEPLAALARDRGALAPRDVALVEAVARRAADGEFDTGDAPARIHGDLWSGNVMWAPGGAVLIDPAAHGGHRETDLAMMDLFGFPHLGAVLDAYQAEAPLAPGWTERVALHQLHPLLLHAAVFGASYAARVRAAAAAYA